MSVSKKKCQVFLRDSVLYLFVLYNFTAFYLDFRFFYSRVFVKSVELYYTFMTAVFLLFYFMKSLYTNMRIISQYEYINIYLHK